MTEVEPDDTAPKIEQDSIDDGDTLTLGERQPLSDEQLSIAARPIVEVKMMLTQGAYVLQTAQEKLAAATITFTRLTSKEGFKTMEAHSASFGEHGGLMKDALSEAAEAAVSVFQQAKDIEEAIGTEREPVLSDVDAIRANSRREFVKEDMLEAPRLSDVQRSLQSALASRDSVSVFLCHRYGVQRLNAARPADNVDPARAACISLLEQMRGMLTDKSPAAVQRQAGELRKKALDFLSHLHDRAAASQRQAPAHQSNTRYSAF